MDHQNFGYWKEDTMGVAFQFSGGTLNEKIQKTWPNFIIEVSIPGPLAWFAGLSSILLQDVNAEIER